MNDVIKTREELLAEISELRLQVARLQTENINSETRYRQMFESHSSIQWLVDPQTQRLVDVNPAAAEFYGYSREKMQQMAVSELNVLSPAEIAAKMRLAQAQEQNYFEVPHRLASGEMRMVEIHATPIQVKGRQLLYAILHDITERKEAEEALRQSNRQLALLNQATEELNSTLDLNYVLITILNEVRNLLGAAASSIWLVDPDTNELICQQATEPQSQIVCGWRLPVREGIAGWVVRNGRSLNIADAQKDERHYRGVDQQTALITRSLLCVPLKLKRESIGVIEVMDSEPAHFSDADLALMENLATTATVAVENARLHQQLANHAAELEAHVEQRTQELVAANRQLKELDRLKTKLVEDISHELRTPIANLTLYLDLLERGKPEKREQYMAVLREKTKQLVRLTEDILQVFRLDLFKGDVDFAVLDLNNVVTEVVAVCRQRLEAADLQLVLNLAQRPLPILAEKKQIEQIITNLLLNAINYTPAGSIQIQTALHGLREHEKEVSLAVQDSGLGIALEDQPYIFDRFYRGKNAAQHNLPGTGLGLSIVKDVVTLHNGRVEMTSQPGQGSTFQIWLPLADAA